METDSSQSACWEAEPKRQKSIWIGTSTTTESTTRRLCLVFVSVCLSVGPWVWSIGARRKKLLADNDFTFLPPIFKTFSSPQDMFGIECRFGKLLRNFLFCVEVAKKQSRGEKGVFAKFSARLFRHFRKHTQHLSQLRGTKDASLSVQGCVRLLISLLQGLNLDVNGCDLPALYFRCLCTPA